MYILFALVSIFIPLHGWKQNRDHYCSMHFFHKIKPGTRCLDVPAVDSGIAAETLGHSRQHLFMYAI